MRAYHTQPDIRLPTPTQSIHTSTPHVSTESLADKRQCEPSSRQTARDNAHLHNTQVSASTTPTASEFYNDERDTRATQLCITEYRYGERDSVLCNPWRATCPVYIYMSAFTHHNYLIRACPIKYHCNGGNKIPHSTRSLSNRQSQERSIYLRLELSARATGDLHNIYSRTQSAMRDHHVITT